MNIIEVTKIKLVKIKIIGPFFEQKFDRTKFS